MTTSTPTVMTLRIGTRYRVESDGELSDFMTLDVDTEGTYVAEIGPFRTYMVSGVMWYVLKADDI